MEGAIVFFEIPILGGIPITSTMVNSWIVMLFIAVMCLILTSSMKRKPKGKQAVAEIIYNALTNLVRQTMGEKNMHFAPYIGTLFIFSLCSSLLTLFALKAPTSDLNTILGWSLITFVLVQYNGLKNKGVKNYLKSFAEPIPVMLPLNLIGEASNVISMTFRHFGNIASGVVITSLLYSALAALSTLILGGIAGGALPAIFQIGIPGILSIYFDLFTAGLQAFIFCMLTMVFVTMSAE